MALRAEVSIPVALATCALVYGLYSNATPSVADIRVGAPDDKDIDASRKMAAWTAAAAVAGISLIAKDPTIFVLGGGSVIALDWWTRHANAVSPEVGKVPMGAGATASAADMSTGYYDDSDGTSQYMAE